MTVTIERLPELTDAGTAQSTGGSAGVLGRAAVPTGPALARPRCRIGAALPRARQRGADRTAGDAEAPPLHPATLEVRTLDGARRTRTEETPMFDWHSWWGLASTTIALAAALVVALITKFIVRAATKRRNGPRR